VHVQFGRASEEEARGVSLMAGSDDTWLTARSAGRASWTTARSLALALLWLMARSAGRASLDPGSLADARIALIPSAAR